MDVSSIIYQTENATVFDNHNGTITKRMKYTASTFREISFNDLLARVDSILHPIETIYHADGVDIIYPKTEDFYQAKLDYHTVYEQCIIILAVLERLKIVHLDFRPENIGVINGKLYLRDFGNAYLLRGDTGYISYFRYPVEQIRAPEFVTFGPEDTSKDLRSFIFLQRTFEPTSVIAQDKLDIIPNLNGSQFDTRADVWSFACWFHHYLLGIWPAGSFFQKDELLQKYGIIGQELVNILDQTNYFIRPDACDLAMENDFEVPYVYLQFKEPQFKHEKLYNFRFADVIGKGYDNGEIISQYSDLLLFTQNSSTGDVGENISFFASTEPLSSRTVEVFRSLGTLYFSSFYERDNIKDFVKLVAKPPRLGTWTWKNQFDYIINSQQTDADDTPSIFQGPSLSKEEEEYIDRKFEEFLEGLPDDREEAVAAGILGDESDEE